MPRPKQPSKSTPQIIPARVFELWGDSPIFPGPSWRLTCSLSPPEQQRLDSAILDGRLWSRLKDAFPELAMMTDSRQLAERSGNESDSVILKSIAALSRFWLLPASLEACEPFLPVKQKPDCLVLRSDQHELAGRALSLAAELIRAAWLLENGARINLHSAQQALADLKAKAEICCGHPLTSAQIAEARRRGIPVFLLDGTKRFYQVGTGVYSRWISSSSNDRDSSFGVAIARNKSKTRQLLIQLGLPVPQEMQLSCTTDDQSLTAAATRIGYPCALKPLEAEQGRGVTANITSESELVAAAKKARAHSATRLLLQNHVFGDDYRLNVINQRLTFAVKRRPPTITGNGQSTILELIDQANALRRQQLKEGEIAAEIKLDDPEVIFNISKHGLKANDILEKERQLQLRGNANISTGGTKEEIETEAIHPVIQKQCLAIASTLRLDVCGIDYITDDISRAPRHGIDAYIEVNSMPQNNAKRAKQLLDSLFPEDQKHSIPCTVVIDDWLSPKPRRELNSLIAKLLQSNSSATIGIPSELEDDILPELSISHQALAQVYKHPRELLLNKSAHYAIYLTTPKLIWSRGLPGTRDAQIMIQTTADTLQSATAWERFIQAKSQRGQAYS